MKIQDGSRAALVRQLEAGIIDQKYFETHDQMILIARQRISEFFFRQGIAPNPNGIFNQVRIEHGFQAIDAPIRTQTARVTL